MSLDYVITFDNPKDYGDAARDQPSSVESAIREADGGLVIIDVLTPGPSTTLTVWTSLPIARLLKAVQSGLSKKGSAVVAVYSNETLKDGSLHDGARAWHYSAGNDWVGLC